jgi:hypothetical protein
LLSRSIDPNWLINFFNQIDYGEMAKLVNYNHAKNAKAAVNKLFDRLKKQHNLATAASSSDAAEKATTPEAGDDDETVEESPKTPVNKATAAKNSKASAAAEKAFDKEESPTKKSVNKEGKVTAKKTATTKKGVGKTTAPKKASAGGPKAPVKGKGKKAAMTEEVEEEVEAEGDVEADKNSDAKSEDPWKNVLEDIPGFPGKSTHSPPADNELPVDIPTTVASPEALAAAVADPAKPMFHILIQGYDYSYAPFDVSVANRYKMTLREYLQWKEYNDYTFYCGPRPYSLEEHLAQEAARKSSGKA